LRRGASKLLCLREGFEKRSYVFLARKTSELGS
jgi:hypothetical protein